MAKVKAVPEGFHTVTPYLGVEGAAKAIEFYQKAFEAKERYRLPMGDKLGHAEILIGDSIVMLSDLMMPGQQRSNTMLCLYVEDCDMWIKRAIAAGAKQDRPVQDQFYGDRSGTVEDPFGIKWTIATHKEDLSPAEIAERAKKLPPM